MSGFPPTDDTEAPQPFSWARLSPLEAAMLRVILPHRRSAPVPVPRAAELAGTTEREAQEVVKRLIEDHGIPIGSSSSSRAPGWYLCADADELALNHEALRGRALSILKRAKAFDPARNALLGELFAGQERLVPRG